MHKRQQDEANSLQRVQAFLDTHADAGGPLKDTAARKQLDVAVEQAGAHGIVQGAAERKFTGVGNQVKNLVDDLRLNHMTPIAKFSRANLRGVPDFKALSTVSHRVRGPALVTEALAMATAAQPYADKLAAAQFPGDSVAELEAAATGLQGALATRTAARDEGIAATAAIKQDLKLGREAVTMLDPIVIKRLAGRKDLLALWRLAKRVKAAPQPAAGPASVAAPAVLAPAPVPAAVTHTPSGTSSVQEAKAA